MGNIVECMERLEKQGELDTREQGSEQLPSEPRPLDFLPGEGVTDSASCHSWGSCSLPPGKGQARRAKGRARARVA